MNLMGSASMDVQDQSTGVGSNTVHTSNQFLAGATIRPFTSAQLKEPMYCNRDDQALKARKPYTITKQRERWTDEEHKKFIEALKLHGRAWRKIEEHVGTKTAVQIRSHAQKFFSKVVRESNTISEEPIEIPPPRPKRKPVHPYPRKVADSSRKRTVALEQSIRSTSPVLSVSEAENQSPKSVLSAFGSDTLGTADSNPSNDCSLPVSSATLVDLGRSLEPNPSPEEEGPRSSVPDTADSCPDDQPSMGLELFPEHSLSTKENPEKQATTRSLKLFGKTVLVTDCYKPTSPTMESQPSNIEDKKLSSDLMNTQYIMSNTECPWGQFATGAAGAVYYMQLQGENLNIKEGGFSAPMPWWNMPLPIFSIHRSEPEKDYPDSSAGAVQEAETQWEGSWSGSNTTSVDGREDKNCNAGEIPGHQLTYDKARNLPSPVSDSRSSENQTFAPTASSGRCTKGFMPYKRCLEERDCTIIDNY